MRILVVDDDPKITALLRRSLAYEGYHVDAVFDGPTALVQAESRQYNLIILDVMLPNMDGLEVCRRLRLASSVPVLMLTARDEIGDRVKGLDNGADDYLVKPFALEELLARVRAILRRYSKTGEVLRLGDLEMELDSRTVRRGIREIVLTAKEFDLLQLFMQNPGRVLKRDEVMIRVWGYDFSGESNVLEVYIGYLRGKLEADGENRLLHTVRGVGYVLRDHV